MSLKLKISRKQLYTPLIDLYYLGKFHLGPVMVLGYILPLTSPLQQMVYSKEIIFIHKTLHGYRY